MGADQKGPSIFFIFKYVNNHDVLFQKMFSKIVNLFFWLSKFGMKLGMRVINFHNHIMYVSINILGSKLRDILWNYKKNFVTAPN